MRLLCINSKGWYVSKRVGRLLDRLRVPGPKYGEEVLATGETKLDGLDCYELAEWPKTGPYEARGFIPLSEQPAEKVAAEQFEEMEVME